MIVTCQACSTRYLVDPRALGSAGRVVRCANCAHTWHQTPPEDLPRSLDVALSADEPSFAGLPRPPALAPEPKPWRTLWTAGLALVVLIVVAGGVLARERIALLWPPAVKLYDTVGLPVKAAACSREILDLRNTKPSRGVENGVPALFIDGEVVNSSSGVRDLPKLTAVLQDRSHKELQRWDFDASAARLAPGASVPFHTSIPQPNPTATGVAVDFSGCV